MLFVNGDWSKVLQNQELFRLYDDKVLNKLNVNNEPLFFSSKTSLGFRQFYEFLQVELGNFFDLFP